MNISNSKTFNFIILSCPTKPTCGTGTYARLVL